MPLVYEENVAVSWVPTIADIAAPTGAEITAGEPLETYIRKDGISFPSSRNMIDTGSIDSSFDTEYPGSKGGTLAITFKRQDRNGNEAAWTAFKDGLAEGYLVFGFEGSNDTAADAVVVYQVVSHYPVLANPGPNTEQTFVVNFGVQAEEMAAVVSA